MTLINTTMERIDPKGTSDRRRDRRSRPQQAVRLVVKDSQYAMVVADLLDFSVSGVRICYRDVYLAPGSTIFLCYPWGEVPARVVWTAVNGNTTQSGVALISIENPLDACRNSNAAMDLERPSVEVQTAEEPLAGASQAPDR